MMQGLLYVPWDIASCNIVVDQKHTGHTIFLLNSCITDISFLKKSISDTNAKIVPFIQKRKKERKKSPA